MTGASVPRTAQKAAVVYNPIKVDLEALRAQVAAESSARDWRIEWLPTSEDDPGGAAASKAIELGSILVIAAGGDGTVRAVAEVLHGTGTSMALLPSGTGNLLARNLKLTLDDSAHSLRTAFTGSDRMIDVAQIELRREDTTIDRHAFLVMAGAGLDARIMDSTDSELKKKVGWLAYAQALIAVLRDTTVLRLQYRVDRRRTRSERAHAIIVGNCGSLPANILLLPDAAVDDGLLDVVVLKPESVRGWLAVIFKIFWENGVVKRTALGRRMRDLESSSLEMFQGRTITIRLSRPEIVELDGDPFGTIVGCRITVEPGALRVKVPDDEAGDRG